MEIAAQPDAVPVQKRRWNMLKKKEFSVFIALMVLCVGLSVLSPYFLKMNNIFNVLRQFSITGILAVGEAMIIITGGIDLSIGSLVGLMGVLIALISNTGMNPLLVLVAAIVVGACVGGINGLLVAGLGINPFIATLGMMSIARGATLLITGGLPFSNETPLMWLGGGYVGPVPVPVLLMFIIAAAGHVFANRTLPGRNIYAVGNNERAARLSGIRVERIKLLVFMLMGALCAISGIILSGTLNSAEPTAGTGYEMDAIAAVILGGASLSGGEGSIVGVIIGAALMGVLRNGFVLLGTSAYWQTVAIGVVIIAAVAIDSLKTKRRA
jgi:ribose transport system permease protein